MSIWFADFAKQQSIDSQVYWLSGKLCDSDLVDDPRGCKLGVTTWWPKIAGIIWSEGATPYVCEGLNDECQVFSSMAREWGCEACQADVENVVHLFMSSEAQHKIVDLLQGEAFCGSLGLEEAEMAICQDAILRYMPPALNVLFEGIGSPAAVCSYLYQLPC